MKFLQNSTKWRGSAMDIKKLQAILMSKGIRITDDDPVFTLVALNEAVLEDITKKYQQVHSDVKPRPSNQTPWFSGGLTVLTVIAITALGVGVAIGSSEKYIMLVGLEGLLIGTMLGFVSTTYFQKKVEQHVTAPANMDERTTWTEDEFQRVANTTRLSNRTLAACHDVLVGGVPSVDAATRHGVVPPQVSRGLKEFQN